MPKVVTANLLATGKVVFLDREGGWIEAIADAERFDDPSAAEAALERAGDDVGRAIIVEPFLVEARVSDTDRPKMTLRDTIRAFGPTIIYEPSGARRA